MTSQLPQDYSYCSGSLFYEDHSVNLYYLNEAYQSIAAEVSEKLQEGFGREFPISSGIWGGTYLIADPTGKSRRRIWRFYCMLNLPQDTPLDDQRHLESMVGFYCDAARAAFGPQGLDLELKMWGGVLPFSNKVRPNITLHLEDKTETIRWLRPIICWNKALWEESIIYDALRLIKELKQNLDYDKGPNLTDPQEIKYMLQDVIITYLTLKEVLDPDFIEHAQPIIDDLMEKFMAGLHEAEDIKKLYETVLYNALVYGYEQGLNAHYLKEGLDIRNFEKWPPNKINWVPGEVKEKLVPPIQKIFQTFKANLQKA